MESAWEKPTSPRYVSCIKLCGHPIIAPFMDASKRAEMRRLRERAVAAERWLQQKRDRGRRISDRADSALSEGNRSPPQRNASSAENSRSLAKPLPTMSQEYVNPVFAPPQIYLPLPSLDDPTACLENTIENQLSFDVNSIPQPTPELKYFDAVCATDGRHLDKTAKGNENSARESSATSLESLATLQDKDSDAGVGVWVNRGIGSEKSSAVLKDGDGGIEVLFSRAQDDSFNTTGSLNTTGSTDLNAYMDLTASSVGSPPPDALRAQDFVLTPYHSALSVAQSRHSVTEAESNATKTRCNTTEAQSDTTESQSNMTETQRSTTDLEHNQTDEETNLKPLNAIDGGLSSNYVQFPCLPSDVSSAVQSSPDVRLKSPDTCLESPDICLKSPGIRLKPSDIGLKLSDICLKSPSIFLTSGPSLVSSDAPQMTVFFTGAYGSDLEHKNTLNVDLLVEKGPELSEQSHGQVIIGERKHFTWKLPSDQECVEGTSSSDFTSPTRCVVDTEARQLVDALDLPAVPPLVRQNSYTLLAGPSPLIVAHMKQRGGGPHSPSPGGYGSATRKGWDLARAKQMWSSADKIHQLFAVPRPPDRHRNASLPASALPSPVKKPHFSPSLEHLPSHGHRPVHTPKATNSPVKQATHSGKKQAAHSLMKQSTRRSLFVADITSASVSARRASLGGPGQRARHHAADCPRQATGVQHDSSYSLKKATASLNIAADLEKQSRERQTRDSQSRDTHSRKTQSRDTQSRDSQFIGSQSRDSQSIGSQSRDTQSTDTQSRDSHSRDCQSRASQSRDTQSTDTQSRDSHSRASQSRDTQVRASQPKQDAECWQGNMLQSEGRRNEKRPGETSFESEVRQVIGTERERLQGELDRQMALLMARQLADQERMRREFRLQEEKLLEDLRRRLSAPVASSAEPADVAPQADGSRLRLAPSVARSEDGDTESNGGRECRDVLEPLQSQRGGPSSDAQLTEGGVRAVVAVRALVAAQDRSGSGPGLTSQRNVGVDLTRESYQHVDAGVDMTLQRNLRNTSVDLTRESYQHIDAGVDMTSQRNLRNTSVDLTRESNQHRDGGVDMTSQRNLRNTSVDLMRESYQYIDGGVDVTSLRNLRNTGNNRHAVYESQKENVGGSVKTDVKPQARPGETFRPLDQNNRLLLDYQPPDQNNRLQSDYQPPEQNNRLQSDYRLPDRNNRLLSDYLPPDHNNQLLPDYRPPPPSPDGIGSRRSSSAATWGDRLSTNSRAGSQGHRYTYSPEEKAAASRIVAAARGYLVRRLMRTNHVRDIVRTIKDVTLAAMELHQEVNDLVREEDVELSRRLIHQLNSSWLSFFDVFFSMSTSERMSLIAADRSRTAARRDSSRAVRRVSSATQRSLKRKLDSHGGSQRNSISPMSRSLPSTRPCSSAHQSSAHQSSASSARHSLASSALLPSRKPWR